MLNGHMFTRVVGQDLMLRLGEPAASHAPSRRHVREMDFTGRPMKGMVFVEPDGLNGPALRQWVMLASRTGILLTSRQGASGRSRGPRSWSPGPQKANPRFRISLSDPRRDGRI